MRNSVRAAALLLCLLSIAVPAAERPAQAQTTASWPHTITTENGSAVVYQPQAISWIDHEKLLARAAVAITRHGEKTPVFGTLEIALRTSVDAASNDVILSEPVLVESHFPALD
ncbi:MAG TPA: hypothetical protein VEC75_11035, partial [Stellaceae bacterium]|nr:hypothetical protein [Stellaceae bacterium]